MKTLVKILVLLAALAALLAGLSLLEQEKSPATWRSTTIRTKSNLPQQTHKPRPCCRAGVLFWKLQGLTVYQARW